MTITLKLKQLVFDRKTVNGAHAAIPVRASMSTEVQQADWRGSNGEADVTPVAYALSTSVGDITDLRVTAMFTAASPLPGPIFIRAIDAQSRLLGDIVSLPLTPADVGPPQPKQFRLTGGRLDRAVIDAYTIEWRWEWSADGQTGWQQFDSSTHPLFVIADQLKAPWGRELAGGDPHTIAPWKDVMAQACKWAKGLQSVDDVVETITAAVDGLAGLQMIDGRVVKYQNGGCGVCEEKIFHINDILRTVERKANAATSLNCQEINTTIAMFSTMLGCEIRMLAFIPNGAPKIKTNGIKVFGRQDVTNALFSFHEVAARPTLPIHERPVWDACLRIDFDPNPAVSPPGVFDLPKGLTIHPAGRDLGYRQRFLEPGSQNCIIAQVETDGLRYPEKPCDDFATPAPDPNYRARKLEISKLMANVPVEGETSSNLLLRFEQWLAGVNREDFRRHMTVGDPPVAVVFTPLSPVVTGGSPMKADVFIAANGKQAVEVFLTLAANHAGVLEPTGVGDFGLQDPDRTTILFLRGPVVALLSDANEEIDSPANFSAAQQLDTNLAPVLTPPITV